MRQVFLKQKSKMLVVALAAAMGASGLTTEARAFTINSSDLVLAVYENNTEYYRDLGQAPALVAPGANTTIDLSLSSLNPMTAVSGPNPVQWTLVRNTFTPPTNKYTTFVNFASVLDSQGIVNSQNTINIAGINGNIRSWESTILPLSAPLGNEVLLNKTDPASFTTAMGVDGNFSGAYSGTDNAHSFQGSLGSVLNIIQGVPSGNAMIDVGNATLLANGQLQICGGAGCSLAAVPLPAAAVLFGSGLVGLVCIARRKLSGEVVAG